MDMRLRVWDEMKQMKFHEEYLCGLVKYYNKWRFNYDIAIVGLSILAASSGFISQAWPAPTVISSLVGLASILKVSARKILIDDQAIRKLNSLSIAYGGCFLKLEGVYRDLSYDKITQDEAFNAFQNVRGKISTLDEELNMNHKRDIAKIKNEAMDYCDSFFTKHF